MIKFRNDCVKNEFVDALCIGIYNCNWAKMKINKGRKMMNNYDTEIVIYQSEDGQTKVDVRFEDETVWLSQKQLADLFHQNEGSREVTRNITYYNLDMIISLGYRVHSRIATQFRRWATEHLKEYLIKGYTMNDEKLKNLVSGYFDFAEIQAMRHNVMHMSDYAEQLDRILEAQGDPVLEGPVKSVISRLLTKRLMNTESIR